jgi:hypothetical protein
VAKKEVAKQAKAGLSLLYGVSNVTEKSKKLSRKTKEAKAVTEASDQEIEANFQADLKMAKEAIENTKDAMTAAANKMFAFCANLLLVEAKYAWDKFVEEQKKATLMFIFKASHRKAYRE